MTQRPDEMQLGKLAMLQTKLFRKVRKGKIDLDQAFRGLTSILQGDDQPAQTELIPNLPPKTPNGYTVLEHHRDDPFTWDPTQIELVHVPSGTDRRRLKEVVEEFSTTRGVDAAVMDYLISNTELIPEAWKFDTFGNTRKIIFPGTLFECPSGFKNMMYIYWEGPRWWNTHNFPEDAPLGNCTYMAVRKVD